jgi:hypothetical protein
MIRGALSNRAVVLALVGVLLSALAWWFTQNFGFNTQRVYVGFSGEARVNPYFAARLLLERLGMRVHQQVEVSRTQALPPGATLVLAASRAELDPPTVDTLLDWVESGGHLVVGVETDLQRDWLLNALEVSAAWPEDDDEEETGRAGHACPAPEEAEIEEVVLPDGRALKAGFEGGPVLVDRSEGHLWRHESRYGTRILAVGWGDGRVTLFSTLRLFSNRSIGEHDHAELLWGVLGDPPSREVFLVRYLDTMSLPKWLWERAPLALVAAGAFLLLWLWRVVPRFGPLVPGAGTDRRSLLEHIRAVGRFHADQRRQGKLLEALRADCLDLFGRVAPLARGLEGAARLREASRLTRINPRELLHAFSGAPATRHDFYSMVRTLARFRRRLTRRP